MSAPFPRPLLELARLYGVQPGYRDAGGQRRQATPDAVMAILRTFGAEVDRAADVPAALRARRDEEWRRPSAPVHVAWDGVALPLELRLPAARASGTTECTLTLEDGDARVWACSLSSLPTEAEHASGTSHFVAKRLPIPSPLPSGYHRLRVEGGGFSAETLIVSAPRRAFGPRSRDWGTFLPLYALRSERSLGIGDLTDLEALACWTGREGGRYVGTLPLFAAFLDEPFEPSPYSPASRLFWNELYVDPTRAPELERSPGARRLLESSRLRAAVAKLDAGEYVDYRRVAELKRRILAELARALDPEDEGFRDFVARRPRLRDYARFRAAGSRLRRPWPEWPAALRDGRITEDDVDLETVRYHEYAQWLFERQLGRLAGDAGRDTARLYLDIPIGVNRVGFDVWCERALFPDDMSAGAPPDPFFSSGQDWGFPPLNPVMLRESRYRYFIDSLRTVMPFAGALRFDHVMGLRRLFWIPAGCEALEGAYVHYRQEELFAILSLESHRHGTRVVGEDLGTVPKEVRTSMGSHHVARMFVLEFAIAPEEQPAVHAVPRDVQACLETHDMPPWPAFWQGDDVAERKRLGIVDAAGAVRESETRERQREGLAAFLTAEGWLARGDASADEVLDASLKFLAASDAWLVLVALEDLWGETTAQNVPGTNGEQRPNWRHRAALTLERMSEDPRVVARLREVNRLRNERSNDG